MHGTTKRPLTQLVRECSHQLKSSITHCLPLHTLSLLYLYTGLQKRQENVIEEEASV